MAAIAFPGFLLTRRSKEGLFQPSSRLLTARRWLHSRRLCALAADHPDDADHQVALLPSGVCRHVSPLGKQYHRVPLSLTATSIRIHSGSSTLTDATGHLNLGTFGYCSTGLTAT
jgi:hypothetical protein